MRWKNNNRKRLLLRRRRFRQKNKSAIQETIQRRARMMQQNEFILLTKYREIIRRELNERERLKEKCSNLRQFTIEKECKKRCNILLENNKGNVQIILKYLEKVEFDLKSMLHRWETKFDYSIEENLKNFKAYLLKRFQTYVSELDLSGFNLKEEDIDSKCKIDDEIVNIERKASLINGLEIDELKRKLKTLKDELEEEEIRELACVKIREREINKLNSEIEQLRHQFDILATKDDLIVVNLTDIIK